MSDGVGVDASLSTTLPTRRLDASMTTGDQTEDPDAALQPDVSPITGEIDDAGSGADAAIGAEGGADADAAIGPGEDAPDGGGEPPVDAGDGGVSHDGGDTTPVDGGCTLVTHTNGVGGTFVNCTALNTENDTEALKACAAADAGGCAKNINLCDAFGASNLECTTSASTCLCWSYSGPGAGHVSKSKAGALCACPLTTDPEWH